MSFDRFRAQTFCENLLGCPTFEDFFKVDFESLVLDSANAYKLSAALKDDASDLFFKGYLTLQEGLNSIKNRNYSWAVIKLYYSVFYMVRADLALRDYGLIRHKGIYYLNALTNSSPVTKGKNGANRSNYSGDHKSTINYFIDLFKNSDILLSQNIEGMNAYEWLMKKRERVNYQERYFNEPSYPDFLEYVDNEIAKNKFSELITSIIEDAYVKTFQPEYSLLAIPIKRALLTQKGFENGGFATCTDTTKLEYLKSHNLIKICIL